MIKFQCSGCQRKIGVKDEAIGKKIKCPQCGAVLTVPNGNSNDTPQDILYDLARDENEQPVVEPPAVESPQDGLFRIQEPTTDCPFCGEKILEKAKKCKHCGEFLHSTSQLALLPFSLGEHESYESISHASSLLPSPVQPKTSQKQKPSHSYSIIIIITILFAMAILGGVLFFSSPLVKISGNGKTINSIAPFAEELQNIQNGLEIGITYQNYSASVLRLKNEFDKINADAHDEHTKYMLTQAKNALDFHILALNDWSKAMNASADYLTDSFKSLRDDCWKSATSSAELFFKKYNTEKQQ